jgi:hypothetical protein
MAGELNVLYGHGASRFCRSNHALKRRFWIGQVGQQKASKNKVAGRAIFKIAGTSYLELDIEPKSLSLRAGQPHTSLVKIYTRDPPRWLYGFRYLECDRCGATTDV